MNSVNPGQAVEQLARYYSLQGMKVLPSVSGWWVELQPFSFLRFPFHELGELTPEDRRHVFWHGPALLLRYQGPAVDGGRRGGLFLCSNKAYDLPALASKARNQTRRGLELCRVVQMEFQTLARLGLSLVMDTYQRQGRGLPKGGAKRWTRVCDAGALVPAVEAWGAFVGERLAAFLIGARVGDCYYILQQDSDSALLNQYPNNALLFSVTKAKLADPGVTCINYGLKAMDPTPGLDRFKHQMGYELVEINEAIELNPMVRPLLDCGGRFVLRQLARRFPQNDLWRKAQALIGSPHP